MSPDDLLRLLRLEPETGRLFWRPNAAVARRLWDEEAMTTRGANGYLTGTIGPKRHYAHRVVYALTHGVWPQGTIDHINGDKADNRAANLRDVSHADNHRNMPRPTNNKSGVVGVRWVGRLGKWSAQIKHSGQVTYLGTFASKDEAASARKAAEAQLGFHPNHGARHV